MIQGNKADFVYVDELVTPHEERKQRQRERKLTDKDRDLDRKQKRTDKRRQYY